jgi:hypothetical protein
MSVYFGARFASRLAAPSLLILHAPQFLLSFLHRPSFLISSFTHHVDDGSDVMENG